MRILSSRHRRWAVPAAVAMAVGTIAGGTAISASAEPKLPPRTAAQLLADLQTARVDGLSGTVVQNADLGLPALPVPGGGQGSSDLSSLIAGTHTLRVWSSGTDKARVALLGTLGESDVIRNGRDVWIWSSNGNTATHTVLPLANGKEHSTAPGNDPATPPLTPQEAAQRALEAIDPTTAVSTDGTAKVAGRSAYELVLAPKDSRSLVGQVRLAIDADKHIPLRVRVIARGRTNPSLEVGFTHLSFAKPDDQQFSFTPPPGVKVTTPRAYLEGPGKGASAPTSVGSGWTRVVIVRGVHLPGMDNNDTATGRDRGADGAGGQLAHVFASLPHVNGPWGSGRLLRSNLFTALVTDDGRLVFGSVEPDLLYQAVAQR